MIRMIGFDSASLTGVIDEANKWLTHREVQFKEEFRYIDIRHSSTSKEGGVIFSIVVIYENLTNNEEIDKKSTPSQ